MTAMNISSARTHLDIVIRKARIHFYKPIQIAEILYHDRMFGDIRPGDVSTYRTQSRKWRDDVTLRLLGTRSTSSARYQDNLFDQNAVPPTAIQTLASLNRSSQGAVEAYIYTKFRERHAQMTKGLDLVINASRSKFKLRTFIDSFRRDPGLTRSVDKIFEIVVYALFSTLLEILDVEISVSIKHVEDTIMHEFADFIEKLLGLSAEITEMHFAPNVYRVGVTNAADRGLDMWANFGVAIQIKHLSLTTELADDISGNISADRVVIVCKDSERDTLISILRQFGSANRIQSVITENDLDRWYDRALTGKSASKIGDKVLDRIRYEIEVEFPSTVQFEGFYAERGYGQFRHLSIWNS